MPTGASRLNSCMDTDGERVMKTFYPSEGQAEITYYPGKSFVRTSNASGTTDEVYYYDALALVAREDANGVRFTIIRIILAALMWY